MVRPTALLLSFMVRPTALLLSIIVLLIALVPTGALAQDDQRCFPETGFCIAGRIRAFWEQNGGLPVFGFPVGPQQEELIEGRPFQAQWFERNRLELHPENAWPYDVLLGRLGVDRLTQQGSDWFTFPKSAPQDGCRFFEETGHNVCGDILAAWRANGLDLDRQDGKTEAESLALFGLPISDAQTETLSDGQPHTVQWFERARFELHPENQPPYHVLLGLLGNEVHVPGAGATATGGRWRITINGAHEELQLRSSSFGSTYTPKPGYTFLVADVTFHNLDPAQTTEVSSKSVAIIGADGTIFTADGAGSDKQFGGGYCVGCSVTSMVAGEEISLGFVFVLKKEIIGQPFKFQFQEVPLIPFRATLK